MTRLPLIVCPACAAEMSVDVVFGHLGTREAVLALAALDPAAKLIPASMRYCALFAPARQRLRHERLATLLDELRALIAPGTLQVGHGPVLPAPRDYWIAGMDHMTGPGRAALNLPMGSHNYLKKTVAGYAEAAGRAAEKARENAAAGRTPVGLPSPPGRGAGGEGPQPAVSPEPRFRPSGGQLQSLSDALRGIAPPSLTPSPSPGGRGEPTPETPAQ